MHLSLYETIWLVGAAIAAGLLWGIFASAIKRKGTPLPLLVLIAAGALWYTADALRLLIGQAVPGVVDAADYAVQMARFGRGFLPSALLATVLAFADEHQIAKGLHRLGLLLTFAPGVIVFFSRSVSSAAHARGLRPVRNGGTSVFRPISAGGLPHGQRQRCTGRFTAGWHSR